MRDTLKYAKLVGNFLAVLAILSILSYWIFDKEILLKYYMLFVYLLTITMVVEWFCMTKILHKIDSEKEEKV